MKSILKLINLVLFFTISTIFVFAYDLGYSTSFNKDYAELFTLDATHNIKENRDMESNINAIFDIYPDYFNTYTKYGNNFTIYLYPNDWYGGKPAQNLSITICSVEINSWYICNKTYSFTLNETLLDNWVYINEETRKIEFLQYFRYAITFIPKQTERFHNYYLININYTVPKLVTKQHENYMAQFGINIPETEILPSNTIFLPSEEDIPIFFPNSIAPIKGYYNLTPLWVFHFKDTGTKQVWYTNLKEIKDNEETMQKKYLFWGAIIGFIISILVLIIEGPIKNWWNKKKDRINILKKNINNSKLDSFKIKPSISEVIFTTK